MKSTSHAHAHTASVNVCTKIFDNVNNKYPNSVSKFPYPNPINIEPKPQLASCTNKLCLDQILRELLNEQLLLLIRNILSTKNEKYRTHPMMITNYPPSGNGSSRLIQFSDDDTHATHSLLYKILPCIYFDRAECYFVEDQEAQTYAIQLLHQEKEHKHKALRVPHKFCTVLQPPEMVAQLPSQNLYQQNPYVSYVSYVFYHIVPTFPQLNPQPQSPYSSWAFFQQQPTQQHVPQGNLSVQVQPCFPQFGATYPSTR